MNIKIKCSRLMIVVGYDAMRPKKNKTLGDNHDQFKKVLKGNVSVFLQIDP